MAFYGVQLGKSIGRDGLPDSCPKTEALTRYPFRRPNYELNKES